jgi:hypothetical protein
MKYCLERHLQLKINDFEQKWQDLSWQWTKGTCLNSEMFVHRMHAVIEMAERRLAGVGTRNKF